MSQFPAITDNRTKNASEMPEYTFPNEISTEGLNFDPYKIVPLYSLNNPFNIIDLAIHRTTNRDQQLNTARHAASYQSMKFHNTVERLRVVHHQLTARNVQNRALTRQIEDGIAGDRIKTSDIARKRNEIKRLDTLGKGHCGLIDPYTVWSGRDLQLHF